MFFWGRLSAIIPRNVLICHKTNEVRFSFFFNLPDKTFDVLDVSKKFMIKVFVTFRSVTQTRINTCYFNGVVNLHGSGQIYV